MIDSTLVNHLPTPQNIPTYTHTILMEEDMRLLQAEESSTTKTKKAYVKAIEVEESLKVEDYNWKSCLMTEDKDLEAKTRPSTVYNNNTTVEETKHRGLLAWARPSTTNKEREDD